jgi:hypothetical protein
MTNHIYAQEISKLTINEVQWFRSSRFISHLEFTLSDGQKCEAGPYESNQSHTFDKSKKITKVEVIIDRSSEGFIS